ncbi:MAG TPA: allantoate amidohydrolase [Stellaceae bacterium]|jgi:allantoate deiminase/N-carbamoyl-L-amino-acid hydrolase|nr:allantoate amidohydrolase [Stellaceae bacterium]
MAEPLSLAALNAMDEAAFVAALGEAFEHSPWVAAAAWHRRPFADIDALHAAMVASVDIAARDRKLALLNAHPELGADKIATEFSRREQAAAGLGAAAEKLRVLNRTYRDRFGYPFILAVKGKSRDAIFAALEERIDRSPADEFTAALNEVAKIARFRLDDMLRESDPLSGIGERLLAQADELGAITEEPGTVTRTFLTPQHRIAAERVMQWMRDAGMAAWMDDIGNVVGRYEGARPGLPALLLGSHLDTVRDAGKYDGILGVLTAIACVDAFHRRGEHPPFAIEVIGFGDEEGVRFQSTLLGSRAVAGTFDRAVLDRKDGAGVALRDALIDYGLDPSRIPGIARRRDNVLAYLELHIEQGPVLEADNLPVGIVTSIAGGTRANFEISGTPGHAGTVPMNLRRDALAAAAEIIVTIEAKARGNPNLVATVGRISASPGATNVIPGRAAFSLDLRSPDDATRRRAYDEIVAAARAVAAQRGVAIAVDRAFESPAVACAPRLMIEIEGAIAALGLPARRLPSGAGHDAMAIADLCEVGMIFVRCKGGISHNPAEAITAADAETGTRLLYEVIRHLPPRR